MPSTDTLHLSPDMLIERNGKIFQYYSISYNHLKIGKLLYYRPDMISDIHRFAIHALHFAEITALQMRFALSEIIHFAQKYYNVPAVNPVFTEKDAQFFV